MEGKNYERKVEARKLEETDYYIYLFSSKVFKLTRIITETITTAK